MPPPDPGADSGFPVAHFAAMHPAGAEPQPSNPASLLVHGQLHSDVPYFGAAPEVIDLASSAHLLAVARNTIDMENDADHFAPGGAMRLEFSAPLSRNRLAFSSKFLC
jgi:hypothetical protein